MAIGDEQNIIVSGKKFLKFLDWKIRDLKEMGGLEIGNISK